MTLLTKKVDLHVVAPTVDLNKLVANNQIHLIDMRDYGMAQANYVTDKLMIAIKEMLVSYKVIPEEFEMTLHAASQYILLTMNEAIAIDFEAEGVVKQQSYQSVDRDMKLGTLTISLVDDADDGSTALVVGFADELTQLGIKLNEA